MIRQTKAYKVAGYSFYVFISLLFIFAIFAGFSYNAMIPSFIAKFIIGLLAGGIVYCFLCLLILSICFIIAYITKNKYCNSPLNQKADIGVIGMLVSILFFVFVSVIIVLH